MRKVAVLLHRRCDRVCVAGMDESTTLAASQDHLLVARMPTTTCWPGTMACYLTHTTKQSQRGGRTTGPRALRPTPVAELVFPYGIGWPGYLRHARDRGHRRGLEILSMLTSRIVVHNRAGLSV